MPNNLYSPERTGLLLIDPYNDFLSDGGKLWPNLQAVAESVGLIENLHALVREARRVGVRVFYAPHHRSEPGDFSTWKHANPYQLASSEMQAFAKDSWGGAFRGEFQPQAGDVIAREHLSASGFANTDLDQQLRQRGIEALVVVGVLANTCVESTSRYAIDLGYHVTLVKDATAAFSDEAMHAAHELNGPTYAHAIVTTEAIVSGLRGLAQVRTP
jgi:nicotinamidase-related amidase